MTKVSLNSGAQCPRTDCGQHFCTAATCSCPPCDCNPCRERTRRAREAPQASLTAVDTAGRLSGIAEQLRARGGIG